MARAITSSATPHCSARSPRYGSANGTQSFALLPGSLAIGGGTTAATNDQRGVARTGHTDIGAFQSQGFNLVITSGNNQSAAPNAVFGSALIVTVSSTHGEPVQNGVVTFTGPGGAGIQNSPLIGDGRRQRAGERHANRERHHRLVQRHRGDGDAAGFRLLLPHECHGGARGNRRSGAHRHERRAADH